MSDAATSNVHRSFRPTIVGAVAIALVVAGLVLGVTVAMGWFILFALGAFGPPMLRELGVLRDHDELQRELSRRAGHRAFLVGSLFLCAVIVAREWAHADLDHDAISASAVLAFLVVPYYLSYLTGFWGAQRATTRILVTFGTVWGAFVVLSEGKDLVAGKPMAFLMEFLTVAPFFALAWACRRWPRVSGALLVALAAGAAVLFRLHRVVSGDQGAIVVALTFALPLAYCGIALLLADRE